MLETLISTFCADRVPKPSFKCIEHRKDTKNGIQILDFEA